MKVLVNLFHPHLERSVVNRAWAERLANQPGITLRRLYALYPDGKIDVAAEQQALAEHERLVFQHPFYWYSTPPLMKQWLDDVLTYGWAYGPGGNALAGKEWLSAISTGGPADSTVRWPLIMKPCALLPMRCWTTFATRCLIHRRSWQRCRPKWKAKA